MANLLDHLNEEPDLNFPIRDKVKLAILAIPKDQEEKMYNLLINALNTKAAIAILQKHGYYDQSDSQTDTDEGESEEEFDRAPEEELPESYEEEPPQRDLIWVKLILILMGVVSFFYIIGTSTGFDPVQAEQLLNSQQVDQIEGVFGHTSSIFYTKLWNALANLSFVNILVIFLVFFNVVADDQNNSASQGTNWPAITGWILIGVALMLTHNVAILICVITTVFSFTRKRESENPNYVPIIMGVLLATLYVLLQQNYLQIPITFADYPKLGLALLKTATFILEPMDWSWALVYVSILIGSINIIRKPELDASAMGTLTGLLAYFAILTGQLPFSNFVGSFDASSLQLNDVYNLGVILLALLSTWLYLSELASQTYKYEALEGDGGKITAILYPLILIIVALGFGKVLSIYVWNIHPIYTILFVFFVECLLMGAVGGVDSTGSPVNQAILEKSLGDITIINMPGVPLRFLIPNNVFALLLHLMYLGEYFIPYMQTLLTQA